jgi:hypothetical protein
MSYQPGENEFYDQNAQRWVTRVGYHSTWTHTGNQVSAPPRRLFPQEQQAQHVAPPRRTTIPAQYAAQPAPSIDTTAQYMAPTGHLAAPRQATEMKIFNDAVQERQAYQK